MKTKMPIAGQSKFYSVADAAWILGVDRSSIHRAIRTGTLPAVRRRSGLMVSAAALARLLDAIEGTNRVSGGAR